MNRKSKTISGPSRRNKRISELKAALEEHQKAKKLQSLDIAFVYASPRYDENQRQRWDLLKFNQEGQGIKRSIKDSGKEIKFKAALGTMENFKTIVSLQPYVLHLTCHGEYDPHDRTKGVLILETENG